MSNARELAQIPSTPSGRRNLIINGAMNVAQRGTTHTLTSNASLYGIDRWRLTKVNMDELVLGYDQSSEVPTGQGFEKSLLVNVDTAETSLIANEYSYLRYPAEGQDLQQLAYGSSSAKSLTLSFWVRSSVTGDYGILVYNSGADRGYTPKYTVNAANTWEKKTITISGDTSGSFNHDNTLGLGLYFNLGSGSDFYGNGTESWGAYDNGQLTVPTQVNLHATQNNKFYITGVQLEVGSVATEFEHRSYGEELTLCKRYYQELNPDERIVGGQGSTRVFVYHLPVEMRADPEHTVTDTKGTTSTGGDTNGFKTFFRWRTAGESSSGWNPWSLANVKLDAEL
jgi:hypothetical protein